MSDSIDLKLLHRAGASNKQQRNSVDFLVNGISLFEATKARNLDMCGRFSSDLKPAQNEEARQIFNLSAPPDTPSGRVMLFVCSECGDLGCGAITIQVSKLDGLYTWSDFAYENNYDQAMTDFNSYSSLGPYHFESEHYQSTLSRAAHA